jgi:15-cis-phytoene desaturase
MAKKVIILGGGVAGMSAAHELVERGFQVTVYEKKSIPGGKARSVPVPKTGKGGNPDLPGEHGFRFFPSFYRHVTDTMKRIPFGNNKQGVFDNLTNTTQIAITQFGKQGVIMLAQFPRSFEELITLLKSAIDLDKYVGLKPDDIEFFGAKLWQYLTTCQDRRMDDLEKIGWWEYVDASNRSEAFQKFLAEGLTRSLVAANAHVANAKVEGDVGIQLILGLSEPGVNADRVLNGPTNVVWIGPWLEYLQSKGVSYNLETHIDTILCDGKTINGVTLQRKDRTTFTDTADYYVLAVPVEQAARLFSEKKHANILKADSTLQGVIELGSHVAWMNGIQFYLKKDVPMIHGHMIHIDTPWALTSISQSQFWRSFNWPAAGNGTVNGILSVDLSEWGSEWDGKVVGKGVLYHKVARDCTREEIKKEVWEQLKMSVNLPGQPPILEDEDVEHIFIDPDIENDVDRSRPTLYKDAEPLYIDVVDSWHLRPDTYTRIPNFFLAADYVRTNTQLATMEGANEAARRAVNSIISASGVDVPLCKIWPLDEPFIFSIWRWFDNKRYESGQPWKSDFPWFVRVAQHLLVSAYQLWHNSTGRKRKVN